MRISFDLDDTLICYQPHVPREPPLPWPWRLVVHDEPLRLGARALLRELARMGHDLNVYTTSYRSPRDVRWWLRAHGIPVREVINQDAHDRHFRAHRDEYPPSKNPRAFGFHLHIDDSEGVRIEGAQHGFQVVVVSPDDLRWAEKILSAVNPPGRATPRRG
jgi:hypothetical protein